MFGLSGGDLGGLTDPSARRFGPERRVLPCRPAASIAEGSRLQVLPEGVRGSLVAPGERRRCLLPPFPFILTSIMRLPLTFVKSYTLVFPLVREIFSDLFRKYEHIRGD